MAKIPPAVSQETIPGFKLLSRGKVRDIYDLGNSFLLSVATDRVSIFDFVLPATVPQKGEVLTALNVFWVLLLADSCEQDLVAFGGKIDEHLPPKLRGNLELQKRATVVKELQMLPIEAVVRGYLTGSGWSAYRETAPNHKVCGHSLPEGFRDGDRLPETIFTPTTKATEGHDEHMNVEDMRRRFDNRVESISVYLFDMASEIARECGIIIADTKLEFGVMREGNGIVLGDERFTPDSSRFWLLEDWERSRKEGRSPVPYDKQFVREWGKKEGIDKLDPKRPEHVEYVHGLTVPKKVLDKTTEIYGNIFRLITGMTLEAFQRDVMGITSVRPS